MKGNCQLWAEQHLCAVVAKLVMLALEGREESQAFELRR